MWIYQETTVLSSYECITNNLCLEDFAYQYTKTNQLTNKKKKKSKGGTQIENKIEKFA